jgi:hypothetical protein
MVEKNDPRKTNYTHKYENSVVWSTSVQLATTTTTRINFST